jgi:hypothetical protein
MKSKSISSSFMNDDNNDNDVGVSLMSFTNNNKSQRACNGELSKQAVAESRLANGRVVCLPVGQVKNTSMISDANNSSSSKRAKEFAAAKSKSSKLLHILCATYLPHLFSLFLCTLVFYLLFQTNSIQHEMNNLKLKTNKLIILFDKLSENEVTALNNKVGN